MSKATRPRIADEIELEALAPRWTAPDGTLLAAPRPRVTDRRRVAALLIAAIVGGSLGTHWFDQRTRTSMSPWIARCQAAVAASARLDRLHNVQLGQELQATWSVVAGVRSPPTPIDTALDRRLQREADEAAARCVSPR
jgi:hypothetical protein